MAGSPAAPRSWRTLAWHEFSACCLAGEPDECQLDRRWDQQAESSCVSKTPARQGAPVVGEAGKAIALAPAEAVPTEHDESEQDDGDQPDGHVTSFLR